MNELVKGVRRFFEPRPRDPRIRDIPVNRIAMGLADDAALAAFKADQERIASRQSGTHFESKRANR